MNIGFYLPCIILLVLTACNNAHDTAVRGLDEVQTNTNNGIDKIRDLADLGHPPSPAVKPQERYCYQVMQDIECYTTPRTDAQLNMTGFQSKQGKTGYQPQDIPPTPGALKQVDVSAAPAVKGDTSADANYAAASSTNSSAGTAKKPVPQGLHEIIFDASELQPKDLVDAKPQ